MGTSGQSQVRFKPRTVSNTVDGDNSPPGACIALKDLVPDPSTPNCFICRPANTVSIDFTSWGGNPGNVGVVTAAFQLGNIVYGLVGVTSGSFAGKDYPFVYNLGTAAFIPVTGITTANVPASQATSGDWTPPQMTLTGVSLVTTHVGFDGVTHFFGVFNTTNPAAPTWTAQNTTTNLLPTVPQGAGSFNNRTYFLCKNVAYYTDTLSLAMTASNQSLTVGDSTIVTCVAPLPQSQASLGIVQALILFKATQIFIVTGDVTQSNLSLNQLSSSVGTTAPRTAVSTPEGVAFMAVDGVRLINFFGILSNPNQDLTIPFIYAVIPSRACAAFNADYYRICVENGAAVSSPFEDYWYRLSTKSWTGPHSFKYDIAVPFSNDFLLASNSLPAKMWDSFTVQGHAGTGSTFIENGTPLAWLYQTSPMTDLDNIYANKADRTTVEISVPSEGQTYNFIAQNENSTILATANISELSNQAIWGSFIWGQVNWGASQSGLVPITIPWNQTVVFNKLSVMISGPSSLGFKISSLHLAYKKLNYLLN